MNSDAHIPRKRFGQHFLHDPGVLQRIVAAIAPVPGQPLVEIGPGEGALTNPLLATGANLHVIELDRDLAARLRGRNAPRLRVIESDVLDIDFRALAGRLGGPLRLVGNLPYNVSSPILFHALAHLDAIVDMHFMLQKEVVDRMAAEPGGKEYGRLSVMLQAWCEVESLFNVGPGAFRPPPKVDSAVARLRPRPPAEVAIADPKRFAAIVKAAFGQRRKTLRNALQGVVPAEAVEAAGLDPGDRAERIPVDGFIRLASLSPANPHPGA
ncbi:16S rRNA (adenine(1518)-N(6)/adenine(1519)-N(6))-dimethyltransferase RsmA [Pseudofulvimonas gallinarii]|uniref:Ribosomal RNA small subunit methyltransferase A n=1 Tax=Pseudofulvimonas gallinarii TaxID=634155 RepID=A0A4R3LJG8_9GAMM|nr:16S rRNA (adenine(1518)-N(6)/adenine(1519)-N(6))-dimethyltransferase RsmA [Pseudofulvimonas gallinarii]TCS99628.1 dimethyladenosine transferase [Pseudofulvimonas gallinarii]THD14804.1 16S rRNA (adenine(1518)-N(6)/adenine(1519)-N(6))-dimethyltransferase [Pseudofulvimonas gallinarii]